MAALGWAIVSNCSSSNADCTGGETCACYGNNTCDEGLACRSNVCVNLSSTGYGGDGTGSGGSSGSGVNVQACLSCAESKCPSQAMDCKSVTGCNDIITCLVGCNKDATCLSKCNANASVDANSKSLAYQTCAFTSCVADCTFSGGSTGAGGSTSTGSGGSAAGSGGSGGSSSPVCAICDKAHACCLAVLQKIGGKPADCDYYVAATCSASMNPSPTQYADECRKLLSQSAMDFPACN
jgi:hypothetical protein